MRRPARPGARRDRARPQRRRGPVTSKGRARRPRRAPDPKVSDAVAHAVKMGYDVITENIRQGREAAERFRQGEYSVREVPGDLRGRRRSAFCAWPANSARRPSTSASGC